MAKKGVIYIMKCISLPGLIKIGKTETKQFEARMRNLEKDGYRHEMLQREFAIEVEDFDAKEKLLHKIYTTSQVGDSELFATDCKAAVELLKAFEGRQVFPVLAVNSKPAQKTVKKDANTISCHMERKIKALGNKVLKAKMEIHNRKFVVLSGSEVSPIETPNASSGIKQRRNQAKIKNNILMADEIFDSPSSASAFILFSPNNGWSTWRLENGEPLQTIRSRIEQ